MKIIDLKDEDSLLKENEEIFKDDECVVFENTNIWI